MLVSVLRNEISDILGHHLDDMRHLALRDIGLHRREDRARRFLGVYRRGTFEPV